jgi:hypothetical protein
MICHGETPTRQLAFHVLLKPNISLLEISGPIPEDYPNAELVLPVSLPLDKSLLFLAVPCGAKAVAYDPDLLLSELAFFQAITRGSLQYDKQAAAFIIRQYASTYQHLQASPPEALVCLLEMLVDALATQDQFPSSPPKA